MQFFLLRFAPGQCRGLTICRELIMPHHDPRPWCVASPLRDIQTPIVYEVSGRDTLRDYVRTDRDQVLVSERLAAIILRMSSVAVSYASEIRKGGRTLRIDFKTIHFERDFSAMDRTRSNFEANPRDGQGWVSRIRRLELDTTSLPRTEHIFRLAEAPVWILVSEVFRREAEAAGLEGLLFADYREHRL